MGSPFNLVFYAPDSVKAHTVSSKAFALIDSLNNIFSDYLSASELSRLSATAGMDSFVAVTPLLYDVLVKSKQAWKKSRHTFDITVGPLTRLWRQARREKKFPDEAAVSEARRKTGLEHVVFEADQRKVKLLRPGMQLDLGGIAKGYVAQQVIDLLRAENIVSAMADAGGDIVCSGSPPGKTGWIIGVNRFGQGELIDQTIALKDASVATSGDLYQYMEHGGKRYSHIIDPRKGYGVTFQRNVTVIAPDGATADWLATACSILPICRAKKLVRREKAHLLIAQMKNGKIKYKSSRGVGRYRTE